MPRAAFPSTELRRSHDNHRHSGPGRARQPKPDSHTCAHQRVAVTSMPTRRTRGSGTERAKTWASPRPRSAWGVAMMKPARSSPRSSPPRSQPPRRRHPLMEPSSRPRRGGHRPPAPAASPRAPARPAVAQAKTRAGRGGRGELTAAQLLQPRPGLGGATASPSGGGGLGPCTRGRRPGWMPARAGGHEPHGPRTPPHVRLHAQPQAGGRHLQCQGDRLARPGSTQ